jgi:hypothetical protein
MEFINEKSQFQLRFWEKRDITGRQGMTYIYLCGNGTQTLYRIFSNLPSVTA